MFVRQYFNCQRKRSFLTQIYLLNLIRQHHPQSGFLIHTFLINFQTHIEGTLDITEFLAEAVLRVFMMCTHSVFDIHLPSQVKVLQRSTWNVSTGEAKDALVIFLMCLMMCGSVLGRVNKEGGEEYLYSPAQLTCLN